mgnify:CR=1 FL=1
MWNELGNVGLVVGATDVSALAAVRVAAPDLWLLAPGVGAQGGDVSYIDQPEKLPQASLVETTNALSSGYIAKVDAHMVAEASVELWARRAKTVDPSDYAVGAVVHTNMGYMLIKY